MSSRTNRVSGRSPNGSSVEAEDFAAISDWVALLMPKAAFIELERFRAQHGLRDLTEALECVIYLASLGDAVFIPAQAVAKWLQKRRAGVALVV